MGRFSLLMIMAFCLFPFMACESQKERTRETRQELRDKAQEFHEKQSQGGEEAGEAREELKGKAQELQKEERKEVKQQVEEETDTGVHGQTQRSKEWASDFTGEVTKVQGDKIMIRDESGRIHTLTISDSQNPEDFKKDILKAGDKVHVDFEQGREYSIHGIKEGGSSK